MKFQLLIIGILISTMLGCAHNAVTRESALTPGMAKKHIIPGKTGQTEVLEIFGPPDMVTQRGELEAWTYDKISQDVTSSNTYLTIFLTGYDRQRSSSVNRSIMLILYFDQNSTVKDYRLSAAKF